MLLVLITLLILLTLPTLEQFTTKLPTSGSEPRYQPEKWNKSGYIKKNNCYAYLLDDLKTRNAKPQPGLYGGVSEKMTYTNCEETFQRMKKDNPNVYKEAGNKPCRYGYYKGYLALDPSRDYHFYRQDRNGMWSHKAGKLPASDVDAAGNPISNPELSNHLYADYQYTKGCSFFCVPSNGVMRTNSV